MRNIPLSRTRGRPLPGDQTDHRWFHQLAIALGIIATIIIILMIFL
ncbi:MAG TPA: hypothetical protein VFV13_14900 [Acidimicrobiia bacterium]|nr:hypothetical protein [Acidimicrobiia bacterium]